MRDQQLPIFREQGSMTSPPKEAEGGQPEQPATPRAQGNLKELMNFHPYLV
jgi:hypothetical protein